MKYQALAPIYDRLMSHVEYDEWIVLLQKIFKKHFKNKSDISILELGGGTGKLGEKIRMHGLKYVGSDYSSQMASQAKKRNLPFVCADARKIPFKGTFDCILFLYDGINYLNSIDEYAGLFNEAGNCLAEDGLFLFDITTETNSINHFYDYLDFDEFDNYSVVRHSFYDELTLTQYNDFTIFNLDQKSSLYTKCKEHHAQKVFPPQLIEEVIPRDIFCIEGIWDDFSMKKYSSKSERIHFLLKKRKSHDPFLACN